MFMDAAASIIDRHLEKFISTAEWFPVFVDQFMLSWEKYQRFINQLNVPCLSSFVVVLHILEQTPLQNVFVLQIQRAR